MKSINMENTQKISQILDRRVQNIFPAKEKVIELLTSKKLKIYYGIDPTGPSIHIGHTTQLLLLKQLAELGHKIIILIGDFTAKIGDPTGKDTTRKSLADKEIKENMKDYIQQIDKVLPKKMFEVKYNSKWHKKMFFEDVIKLVSHVTVQQTIARDMFQERIKNEKPIGLHEFLYPLMQGYDAVAMKVDGEVGGNDQTFNMLIGRDLVRDYLGKEKIVLATKLIIDPNSGKKMSKSEGPLISLADLPQDVFGKTMAMPDEIVPIVFELCTEKDQAWIDEADQKVKAGANPKTFKEELAFELVKMYYGEEAAQKAKKEFKLVFSEKNKPLNRPEIIGQGTVIQTMVAAGIVLSNTEGKNLINEGAIKLNNKKVEKGDEPDKPGDELQVGPRRFYKIK